VTTGFLGKAVVPNASYEQPDGSPIRIATDYLGTRREKGNPFPGPFELSKEGTQALKVRSASTPRQ